jgi:tetratricopeptide (TPR) repeat protein
MRILSHTLTAFFCLTCIACATKSHQLPHDHDSFDELEFDESSAEARYLFLTSELFLKKERFDEALSMLEEASSITENSSPTILKRLTQLYIKQGDMSKALHTTDILLELDPDSIDALQLKAGTLAAIGKIDEAVAVYYDIFSRQEEVDEEPYLLLSGLLIQNGRKEEAGRVLRELISKNPDSFIGTYYLAKLYFTLGDNLLAIKNYERALELNPSADQVALELIQVLAVDRQISRAIERCQKLIAQSPGNAKAKSFLAELLLGEQKIEEALKVFEEAKKDDDSPSELQFKVALIKLQKKDYEGAEAELRLLLVKNPEYHQARYYLATAYASQERINEAVTELTTVPPDHRLYKKSIGFASFLLRAAGNHVRALEVVENALKYHPSDIELMSYKADALKQSGDTAGVVATLEKIYELEPENEQHLFNLGVAYDDAGDKGKALELMEEVIRRNPLHANALNYLAYSLAEAKEDLARAEELVKRAIKIEKDNGYFIDSLGWIYFQLGKYKEALQQLERANELVHADPVIMDHLGRTYLKLGMKDKAKSILRQAFELLEGDATQKDLRNEIGEILDSLK